MRNVLRNTNEVFHYWANGVQPSGRSGNVSFEGPKVFTYAEPIGYLYSGYVLLRNHGWSVTSSRHCTQAWRAARQHKPLHVWSLPRGRHIDSLVHNENRKHYESEILDNLTKADEPRRRKARDRYLETAHGMVENYREYRQLFNLDWPEEPTVEGIRERMAQAEREIAEASERSIREAAEEHQRRVAEEQEDLLKWRSGEDVRRYFAATALRVNGDRIETTHWAEIPVRDAVRVWPLLCRTKAAGGIEGDIFSRRLGIYRLDSFDGETLVAGCHRIPWSELELIAKQLGLPAYEPAKEAA